MSDLVKRLRVPLPYLGAETFNNEREDAADRIAWLEGERRKLLDNAQTLQGAIDRLCGQNKRLEKENARFQRGLADIIENFLDLDRLMPGEIK